MKTELYIGLDVHKNSIAVATAAADGSPPQHDGKWGGSNLAAERGLLKLLKKSGLEKGEVRVAYEAGRRGSSSPTACSSSATTASWSPPPRCPPSRASGSKPTGATPASWRACKQQLAMFLLRNGSRYDGKTTWTRST